MAVAVQSRELTVTVRMGPAALDLLDERWDALALRAPVPNPLLSAPWLRTLGRFCAGVPLVAVAEDDGLLVAGGAFELRRPAGRLGPAVAGWLGPSEQLRAPDVLTLPGRTEAAEALVRAVLTEADVLSILVRTAGDASAAVAAVAPWHRRRPSFEGWLLDVPAPRIDGARKRVARDLRRAARLGIAVETRVAAEPAAVARALERLFRLHRQRWQDRPGELPRFGKTAALRRFNRAAVAAMAGCGRARILELLEDGVPVAGTLCFLHGRGALGHTQAVGPTRALREAGHDAALAALDLLAAEGVELFDLGLGGGEPGSPKARLGPVAYSTEALFAAATPQRQHAYEVVRRLKRSVP